MSDIDPFKEPPVYKYDQVVTVGDLTKISERYKSAELAFKLQGDIDKGQIACIMHQVVDDIIDWVDNKKPPRYEENEDE